jgi:hypothetical protein
MGCGFASRANVRRVSSVFRCLVFWRVKYLIFLYSAADRGRDGLGREGPGSDQQQRKQQTFHGNSNEVYASPFGKPVVSRG